MKTEAEHKFFMPGDWEKPMVLTILQPRTPLLNHEFWLNRGTSESYAHAKNDGCPFCWYRDEARLRENELARWADEGGAAPLPRVEDFPELNPRWVLWAFSRGAHPYDTLRRTPIDEVVYLVDYDDEQHRTLPAPMVLSLWIQKQWRVWAAEMGFVATRDGLYGYEQAQRFIGADAHAHFDAWLRLRTGA